MHFFPQLASFVQFFLTVTATSRSLTETIPPNSRGGKDPLRKRLCRHPPSEFLENDSLTDNGRELPTRSRRKKKK